MGGQPVLADIDAVDQARGHHVPAERSLQPAQDEEADDARPVPARHSPGQGKEQEGQ